MKIWNDLNKKQKRNIIIGFIVLVLTIYVVRNWNKITYRFRPLNINFEDGENINISSDRKNIIEGIARSLKTDIYDTPWSGHDYTPYTSANNLTDNELAYLAKFYLRNMSRGNTLYDDMNGEYYITGSDITSQLMSRLSSIGLA